MDSCRQTSAASTQSARASQKSPLSCTSGTAACFAQLVELHPERDGDYGGTEPTMRSPSGDGGDSGRFRPAHFPLEAGRVPGEMVAGMGEAWCTGGGKARGGGALYNQPDI